MIFVTGFDAPLSEAETEFLAEVRRHVQKLFFVVNKLDLATPNEVDEIVGFVHERVSERSGGAELRVFAVSARDALEARERGSAERLVESGLPELEQALVGFLTGEKARSFLLAVGSRAEILLAQLRLDLELGVIAQAHRAGEHAERVAVFEHRVGSLLAQQRQIADRLLTRVAAELPGILAERSLAWTRELRRLVLAELDARRPPPRSGDDARGWVRDAAQHLQDAAPRLLERWLRRCRTEVRELLLGLASGELAELESMSSSVEHLAAESFGVRVRDPGIASTWSPTDLPQLAVETVAFSVAVNPPRRSWGRSGPKLESEARRRLSESIEAAVTAYVDDLRDALARAARRWIEDIAVANQRETQTAAERVRAHAREPGGDAQLLVLAELEQRLDSYRAELAGWEPAATHVPAEESVAPRPTPSSEIASRCAICERVARVPFDYMAHAQWELVRRDRRRAEHVLDGGFCAMHTWQYAEIASDVGIALAYATLARSAADLLEPVDGDDAAAELLRASAARLMPGPDRCPACVALSEAERTAVREFLAALPVRDEGEIAPSLCVRHLAGALATDLGTPQARWLARRLAGVLRRASEDMQTFSLKRESLRGHLLSDEEQAACRRAISYLAGYRELARPWRQSDEIG